MLALLLCPAQIRTPVAWCGLAAVVLAGLTSAGTARRLRAAEAARHKRASEGAAKYYEQREAALLGRLADQRATTVWLAEELLPAAVARLKRGDPASDILRAVDFGKHLDEEFADALKGALRTLLEAVEAEEHTRDASQRALVAVARRVQAIVHQLAKDLHAMQILHGNDIVVSRGLQDVDHRNALIGRLAASIAVLGDARPGRQWSKSIPLYDILRGAMSRIVDYPRVKLRAVAEVAVTGPGSEPLMHLLAELLDNATSFSPPHAPVEVTANEVPSGVAIEIEDRGVGLTEEVRQRVERVMAQSQRTIQLASLGEVTQLGLPVVSRLAREHGCEVHLRTSAYGGVRAVVLVPRRLITTMPQPAVRPDDFAKRRAAGTGRTLGGPVRTAPASAPTPPPVPAPAPMPAPLPSPALAAENGEVRKSPNGLPQRRRESPVPIPVVVTGPTTPATPASSRPSPQPGLMWEAFNGEKRAAAEPSPFPSEPSDEVE
ncbi:ATP-binding protein [Streptomyces sp. NPDC090109]|uniref:ATP-binding protein n=1 Tax=unclassified Streptomyces TaxID=2593676 RepID=UPI000EF79732|nr:MULTISPECIES: ATP-binding protein [unclassified Streptomyces]MZE55476.1 ATP-binding protein [Streptomyces sp. SID5770]